MRRIPILPETRFLCEMLTNSGLVTINYLGYLG
ncbi:hypothetical protein N39L_39570 [Limnospira platensis NIES-39]|nr:hypothetical protein N39L_39570 [Arthrospira platensis NIES-39]